MSRQLQRMTITLRRAYGVEKEGTKVNLTPVIAIGSENCGAGKLIVDEKKKVQKSDQI